MIRRTDHLERSDVSPASQPASASYNCISVKNMFPSALSMITVNPSVICFCAST